MKNEYNFNLRMVAFVDILGFKELIKVNQVLSQEILNMLYSIRQSNLEFKIEKTFSGNACHAKIFPDIMSFSDHIIFSIPITDNDSI